MVEQSSAGKADRIQSALASKDAYAHYMDEAFDELESVPDPGELDLAANELLLLITRHREFTSAERLLQLSYVSHFTMGALRRFSDPNGDPQVVHQADMIHAAYAQVYGLAMLELAKLGPATP